MNEKTGDTHRSDVIGGADDLTNDPSTEHKDAARADGPRANEVTDRREPPKGPTTHDDTRIARKDGA